jgi:hypothetical protein
MPFLTDIDSRAEVKGSRDPLGMMAVWARFGREVVGNLTTITNSVRGFTTLLLGLSFAAEAQEREPSVPLLEAFLKFEQLAAYARVRHNAGDTGGETASVRGLRRVNKNLAKGKRVPISTSSADQILSNQKVYGLWGLFSMPARNSGFVVPGSPMLTPAARDFVRREYAPLLRKHARTIAKILREKGSTFDVDGELAHDLARLHGPLSGAEKDFYRHHLAWGGDGDPTSGRQRQLAGLAAAIPTDAFGRREFDLVRRRCEAAGFDTLGASLARIDAVERLLNPARVVFGYLLTQHQQPVAHLVRSVRGEWPSPPRVDLDAIERLRGGIVAASGEELAAGWIGIAQSVAAGDYEALIRGLVELNARVMQYRGGAAAWLTIESERLLIRSSEAAEPLQTVTAVEEMWRSTFFINSLWSVSREVGEA